MIHQELQQVPELSVAQNIYLGGALRRMGGLLVDRAGQEAEARRLLAPLDASIDVTAPVRSLRVAQRQIVEIAKALRSNARIIAMDEPTSSLTPNEFERLVQVVAKLAAQGVSIIYVSHKMDEVFRLCSPPRMLRDGRLVGQVPIPRNACAASDRAYGGPRTGRRAPSRLCHRAGGAEGAGSVPGSRRAGRKFYSARRRSAGHCRSGRCGSDRAAALDRRGGPGRRGDGRWSMVSLPHQAPARGSVQASVWCPKNASVTASSVTAP